MVRHFLSIHYHFFVTKLRLYLNLLNHHIILIIIQSIFAKILAIKSLNLGYSTNFQCYLINSINFIICHFIKNF